MTGWHARTCPAEQPETRQAMIGGDPAGGITGAGAAGPDRADAPCPGRRRAPCGCGLAAAVPCGAQVQVLVPLGAALGVTDELAELVGHGPLDPDLLRQLLHTSPVLRAVWIDQHGIPVAVADTTSRPRRHDPVDLRRALLTLAATPPPPPDQHHPRHPHDHPPRPGSTSTGPAGQHRRDPGTDTDIGGQADAAITGEVDAGAKSGAGGCAEAAGGRRGRHGARLARPARPRTAQARSVPHRGRQPRVEPPAHAPLAHPAQAPSARPSRRRRRSRRARHQHARRPPGRNARALPARAATAPAAHRAPAAVRMARVRRAGHPLRPRPRPRLAHRTDLRLQPRATVPPPPPHQADRLDQDPHPTRGQLDQPDRPDLDQPHPPPTRRPADPPARTRPRPAPAGPAQPHRARTGTVEPRPRQPPVPRHHPQHLLRRRRPRRPERPRTTTTATATTKATGSDAATPTGPSTSPTPRPGSPGPPDAPSRLMTGGPDARQDNARGGSTDTRRAGTASTPPAPLPSAG